MGRQISEKKQRQVIAMGAEGVVYGVIASRLSISQSAVSAIIKRGTVKPVRAPRDPTPEDIETQKAFFRARQLIAMEGKRGAGKPHEARPPLHVSYHGNTVVFEGDEMDVDKRERY